jgi:uncharacterized protein YkwD
MSHRPLALMVAGVMAAILATVLVMVALQPATMTPEPTSSGREGGYDSARETANASPTRPPQPPPPAATPVDPAKIPPAPPGADPAEAEVLALVNTERSAAGCPTLAWDETLAQVARLHSADMAARDYVDHTNPEGLSPFDRAANAGTSASAENIAAGQRAAADAMASWMSSPGHRANILNCAMTRLGVGVGYGGSYGITWTQLFGS